MSKILNKDFRKELYKNLVDGGYSKEESTKIVSIKYHEELKAKVLNNLQNQIQEIEKNNYSLVINLDEIVNDLSELNKLSDFIK